MFFFVIICFTPSEFPSSLVFFLLHNFFGNLKSNILYTGKHLRQNDKGHFTYPIER